MRITINWTPRRGTMDVRSRFVDGGSWTDQAEGVDLSLGSIAYDRLDDDAERIQVRINGGKWCEVGVAIGNTTLTLA